MQTPIAIGRARAVHTTEETITCSLTRSLTLSLSRQRTDLINDDVAATASVRPGVDLQRAGFALKIDVRGPRGAVNRVGDRKRIGLGEPLV